ncbi:MAG: hemolysin III family protein [Candidatus Marinimicrobia bacterium]|nr:hemolysin III family protein [Candidatus Neomarinimicrobiota bacterium]
MENLRSNIRKECPEFIIEHKERFSRREEIANTWSHAAGLLFSLAAFVVMLVISAQKGAAVYVISSTVYGLSMLILYLSSTLMHALPPGHWKDYFHNIDQIAIYLLIAGTYTPIALLVLKDDWGAMLLIIEWILALCGICLKLLMPGNFERGVNILIIVSYILMGWMLLLFLNPLMRNLEPTGIYLILLGGAFYTLGIFFFKSEKIKHNHLMWHLMVLAGTIVHWMAVLKYALRI